MRLKCPNQGQVCRATSPKRGNNDLSAKDFPYQEVHKCVTCGPVRRSQEDFLEFHFGPIGYHDA